MPAARHGTSSPAARRAVTRQREAAARARIESKRLAGERYRARLGRARAASAPDTADAARAAARAAASERRPSAPTDNRNNSPAANAAAAAAAAEARAPRLRISAGAADGFEAAATTAAAAAEATALEEDAAASIAADEAAADDGVGEPSAPLVPAETPGVDRTAAGADPTSYTQRLNRARVASQPQDAESKFGSHAGRLRRARE